MINSEQGGALDVHLRKMGAYMSVMERLDICLEGALGLEYLHQNGILHR